MTKNTFKIKNHFANLCRLALILVFISVFAEVNAQSSVNTDSKSGITPVTPQSSSLDAAPAPVASEAVVNELKTAQPESGTMNATTVMPAAPAAVQPQAPAATQEKKQSNKKQPK